MKRLLHISLAAMMVLVACSKDPKPGKKFAAPKVVDLGIEVNGVNVKWGSFNVGATKESDYGLYFSWGELSDKDLYEWNSYQFGEKDSYNVTRYCPGDKSFRWAGGGSPDGLTILQTSNDVARQRIGKKWRMPTFNEVLALINTKTDPDYVWEWTEIDGHKGYKITSKKAGSEGNSIFLPAAGSISSGSEPSSVGQMCDFWSSSLDTSDPSRAYSFGFGYYGSDDQRVGTGAYSRSYGLVIRPVSAE
ncbi:MAG: hypothetical protein IJM35_08895 [Bacteroidales bacterium]|nr:hypothetical protein [Bacteroidales bacterium]